MAKLTIPSSLKKYTNNLNFLEIKEVNNVEELLRSIIHEYPQLGINIFSQSGKLHSFINIIVNGKNIRLLDGEKTTLDSQSEVILIAAIAGG